VCIIQETLFQLGAQPLWGSVCYSKVDVRLPGKGNSNSHSARPVHLIITMVQWIRTMRLSIKNSLSLCPLAAGLLSNREPSTQVMTLELSLKPASTHLHPQPPPLIHLCQSPIPERARIMLTGLVPSQSAIQGSHKAASPRPKP